jgi:indolepyruvate ferredoxin oxidoreductase
MTTTEFDLAARLAATDGTVAMTGVQAVIRVPLDQRRADDAAGLRTAGLIAGYRGSPLGGVDRAFAENRAVLEGAAIKFINGLNEDLAATVVWGSQLASLEPGARYDGVLGMWYGKGPGVDRTGDAFRHANFSGVAHRGGVLAVAGDDPACKSSTIPSASEWALADLAMPILFPGTVQEVLDLGRFGFELSRACGAWVGFKIHTDVADAYTTVDLDHDRLTVAPFVYEIDGKPWRHTQDNRLLAPNSIELEREAFGHRLDAARAFVAAQRLDVQIGAGDGAWLTIVAAGKCYRDVREALTRLGIANEDDLRALGVRIYKPALVWPLEPEALRDAARGVEEIIVVEEKRAFIETSVRDLLYGRVDHPRVIGKSDDEGRALVPGYGALSAEQLVEPLRARLARRLPAERLAPPPRPRIAIAVTADAVANDAAAVDEQLPGRTPYFCSGCPHNRSTVVPDGSVAAGGIGCHGMALYMDRGHVGICQMGGEGTQWVGTQPFVTDVHRFQNLGDGTFFHSGSLAVRQAVSAGTDITYKILYNGVVAMTGGQHAAGEVPVPDLTRLLEAEGVVRTVVVTDDPGKYAKNERWAANSRIEHRDKLDDIQRELRDVRGVTALVYDQGCAAELRRGRKRGTVAVPTTRVMINEDICDGCGDCGRVSNCMSVHPVETPFGRKTRIHQESCNVDLSCLSGNCPAFATVEIDPTYKPRKVLAEVRDGDLPAPPTLPTSANIVLVGIGGTGVVTVNQVIATAALLDGKYSTGLDQTGLSQKGGPVVSNLRVSDVQGEGSNRVGHGQADALLVFDVVAGTSADVLARAAADRTTAVVASALLPTGSMVSGRSSERFPGLDRFRRRLDRVTVADRSVWLDAEGIARSVFGSQPAANVLVLGIAWQLGLLPVSADSIERAIALNGVAVEMNVNAFRLGRRLAADPSLAAELDSTTDGAAPTSPPPLSKRAQRLVDMVPGDAALTDVLAWRVPELIAWKDESYARDYVAFVERVRRDEVALGNGRNDLSTNVARQLFKLMAYKDEYEVARLALRGDIAGQARQRFGPSAKVSFQLKPPSLKKVGIDRKVAINERAAKAMFNGLLRTKRLRGTALDPFGRTEERKIERALIGEYRATVERLLGALSADGYDDAASIANLADQIRGFDTVKLANVARYRDQVADATDRYIASGRSAGDRSGNHGN